MIKQCKKDALHNLCIGKYNVLWGKYELDNYEEANEFITVCDLHMQCDMKRHPWSKNTQVMLDISKKQCALCMSDIKITNGKNHCVKHMITMAGKNYNVPCNYFDKIVGYNLKFNTTKFHEDCKKCDAYICVGCRGHYETIKELEEQQMKYLKLLASTIPADNKYSSLSCINENLSSSPEPLSLKDYAVFYICNQYQDWELHVHSDKELSLCKLDKKTNCSAKKLKITQSCAGITFSYSLWNKDLPPSLSPPAIKNDLSLHSFHTKLHTMLGQLEDIRFCEGINIGEAVSIVKNQPQADASVDQSTFSTENKVITQTVRSNGCLFHTLNKSAKCENCTAYFRKTLQHKI